MFIHYLTLLVMNKYATFSPLGPFGPKVFYVRCEK